MMNRKPLGLLANRFGDLDRDRWSQPPGGYLFVHFDRLADDIDDAGSACRALGVEWRRVRTGWGRNRSPEFEAVVVPEEEAERVGRVLEWLATGELRIGDDGDLESVSPRLRVAVVEVEADPQAMASVRGR